MASEFQKIVRAELIAARAKHPGKQHSLHEGYAVLLEEVDELWSEVRLKKELRSKTAVLMELVQIAAMAQMTAEDMGFVEPETFTE